jgi:hypothetical protein
MSFVCKRCGYETDIKHSLIRHLQKLNECPDIYDSIDRMILVQALTDKRCCKTFDCKHCGRCFADKSNMYRHMKTCPHKVQIKHSKKPSASTSIQLKEFGFETMDHLPREFLNACFANKRITELIDNIHFDRETPENHNVRLRSTKKKYMEVFENGRWTTKDQDQTLTDLIQKGYRILSKHGRKNKDDLMEEEYLDEEDFHEVCEWMERVYDDQRAQKPLKRDLIIRFLNNQAIFLAR